MQKGVGSQPRQNRSKAVLASTSPLHVLSDQQRVLVEALVAGKPPKIAAQLAGYASPEKTAYKACAQPRIQAAIKYLYKKHEAVSDISRKKVMDGFLEAIEMAKMQADAGNMVAGWREIGRMCGYYAPEVKKIDISITAKRVIDKMETLSDEDLLRMVEESGQVIEMEATELLEHAQKESDAEEA